ncbi:Maf family protein [Mycolicibacterium litorale]|uniref:Nucleoside triphosphate pyrophosphatase n=1 Tax=Mycolicibacterium litorale TaxID=758802 RepID=A0AAD1IMN8_9MYCO|nr:Maf family nucleotide pyrophosphatase [Mycolicibacterium litorale]MCV7416062.1 septum formation inhibitor Maf [Mycolicibacterium litorale]TDY09315.1 septum formation protein [Mycolicibacterium litorale]BBY17258.1 Maf-like protein [Mycolicibacterium litorale]
MTRVVLGSASSGRLKVLRHAGIEPLVVVSGVDEDAIVATLGAAAPPDQVVCALAAAKAAGVADALTPDVSADCVVIGCDSMLWFDGRLTGKPGSVAAARAQWQLMAGRSGELYTGHCLVRIRDGVVQGRELEAASTTVRFGTPSPADLAGYLDSGEPLGVAGGFTLDGLGGWFLDGIDGDPSNVIGLSLPLVRGMFGRLGLSVTQLWAH